MTSSCSNLERAQHQQDSNTPQGMTQTEAMYSIRKKKWTKQFNLYDNDNVVNYGTRMMTAFHKSLNSVSLGQLVSKSHLINWKSNLAQKVFTNNAVTK